MKYYCLLFIIMMGCAQNKETANQKVITTDSLSSVTAPADSVEETEEEEEITVCEVTPEHQVLLNKIKNDKLRKVLSCFTLKEVPFRMPILSDGNGMSKEAVTTFFMDSLDLDMVKEENEMGEDNDRWFRMNSYYPNVVFYQKETIGVIVVQNYSPGAFGINNDFYYLFLFNYKGELLNKIELGCNCLDTNMGSNDYFSNSIDSAFIEKNKIRLYTTDAHGTLVSDPESETPEFLEEKKDSTVKSY